jgi:hypothetical protein
MPSDSSIHTTYTTSNSPAAREGQGHGPNPPQANRLLAVKLRLTEDGVFIRDYIRTVNGGMTATASSNFGDLEIMKPPQFLPSRVLPPDATPPVSRPVPPAPALAVSLFLATSADSLIHPESIIVCYVR